MHWVLLVGLFAAAFVGFMLWVIRNLSSEEGRKSKIERLVDQAVSHRNDLAEVIQSFSDLQSQCPEWETGDNQNAKTLRRLNQRKEYLKQLLRFEMDEIADVRQREAALEILRKQGDLEARLNEIVSEVEGTLSELERDHNAVPSLGGQYAETLAQRYPDTKEPQS